MSELVIAVVIAGASVLHVPHNVTDEACSKDVIDMNEFLSGAST